MSVLGTLLKRNRIWVLGSVIAALFSNLSQLFYTYYVGQLVNKIESRAAIGVSFIILLGLFVIANSVTLFINQYVGRYAAEKMAHSLRVGYARKLLWKASENREKCDTASAMSVAQNELAQSDAYLGNAFFDITGMIFTGILAMVFLLFQNVLLTIVLIMPTVIILIYVMISSRKLSDIVSSAQQEKGKMNKIAYSIVHAFPAVKTFDGEELCKKSFDERIVKWTKYQTKVGRLSAFYNTLSGILSRVPLLILLLVGGYMVLNGKILMGTLIVFLNLQKSLTMTIMNLPAWISGFKVFTTNLSRIEIL